MANQHIYLDEDLIQAANRIQDRVEFSGRTKVIRLFYKLKKLTKNYACGRHSTVVNNIYNKWAKI